MLNPNNPPIVVAVLSNNAKAALLSNRAFIRAWVARTRDFWRENPASVSPAKGGLAPWTASRCLELVRTRRSEGMNLDELRAQTRLSVFHFARMLKKSLGVRPRVHLMRLRMKKACELLEQTILPITESALDVGYSSNQVLTRVFLTHMRFSPYDDRRAVRDPLRASISLHAPPALEGRQ